MRICRIGTKYYDGLIKSIQLICDLVKINKNPVKLLIIGKVEDENIYQDLLCKSINLPITFHISENFTYEASKFLNLADAIIGTGRGAIEASSLGKPVLVFEQNLNIPLLITSKEIWNQSLYYNFSERTQLNFISRQENMENIIKTIVDVKFRNHISQQTLNFFKDDLSICDVNNKYINAYCASNNYMLTFRNFDFFSFLKSWYSFVKLR
jgi:glycosyltransferase involved in cell wall biosynthesis